MADWMLRPEVVSAFTALSAALAGWGTYRVTKAKLATEKAANLFDDALALSDSYKVAYEAAIAEVQQLRLAVEELKGEVQDLIRVGEVWRAAAYRAAEDAGLPGGLVPSWWPHGEPPPRAGVDHVGA